ncbi:MAG: N-acetylneuraminate synthase family protein [Treponema sp.]|nr:N-acetylneuraminate synthase family protein [Treponema sp.]
MVKAREMTAAAAQAGADCIKFQLVIADEILHPKTGEVDLPGGRIRLYDRFKSLETPIEFFAEIKEYVESLGLIFLCTPFGLKSASMLQKINPEIIKIASPELNFTGLLEEIEKWNLPVLLSTGVSMLGGIEEAVDIFRRRTDVTEENINTQSCGSPPPAAGSKLCLLHCVTCYPAPVTDYNLRVLPNLAAIFGVPAGVSDHSSDPELVPALAVACGAAVIEKHFCISRTDPGLDDPIALAPDDFSKMVKAIRKAAQTCPEETIAHYIREHGDSLIEQILGSGIKELAPCEKTNYRLTNRSIHALRDIAEGEILKRSDYAVLRTEKILRPGLEPCWEYAIEGRAARCFIPAGEGIRFSDI